MTPTCTAYLQQYGHHCLPHTGLDLTWIALAAMFALIAGGVLIHIARQNRRIP